MKILCFFLLISSVTLTHPANGEYRAALKFLAKTFYEMATEKPPKKQIIVPPYSILHSFKKDAQNIKFFVNNLGTFVSFIAFGKAPQNLYAQKIASWFQRYAPYWVSASALALVAFIAYKAYQNDDGEYRALSIALPISFVLSYGVYKLGQYGAFKEKYRKLLAENR